jgi:hypothetical protein
MAEKSGFFNSNNGDRVYSAVDFAAYFGDLVSNGIFFRTTNNLSVTAASGMNITVQPGSGWIGGYHYQNTTPLELTISTANGVNPRIDRVVLRWDGVARSIILAVKTGVAAATPAAPELTRTTDVWELGLADVLVARSVVSIAADAITDTRLNSNLCGLVNSLVMAVYE